MKDFSPTTKKIELCMPLNENEVKEVFKHYGSDYGPKAISYFSRFFNRYYQEKLMRGNISPLIEGLEEFLFQDKFGHIKFDEDNERITLTTSEGTSSYYATDKLIGAFYLMTINHDIKTVS